MFRSLNKRYATAARARARKAAPTPMPACAAVERLGGWAMVVDSGGAVWDADEDKVAATGGLVVAELVALEVVLLV